MPEDKKTNTISLDTKVSVSIKSLLGIIAFVFSVTYGFYKLVIVPDLSGIKERIIKLDENDTKHYDQLLSIRNSIGLLQGSVNSIKGTIPEEEKELSEEQGGSLGD